jgi:DNA-directed RNA polymerase specialized sigma24 family protein
MPSIDLHQWLSDKSRLKALTAAVRAKVPDCDVEDIVQQALADALVANAPPSEASQFDRWLFGIAKHKVADYYRRHHRHEPIDEEFFASYEGATTPESARDLLRWVNKEVPKEAETTRTLEWMMREASGDHLETIAEEQQLSAPLVRQRVSRLRRFLRERWALQLAAALGLFVVATGLYAYQNYREVTPKLRPESAKVDSNPSPHELAKSLRDEATKACEKGQWQECLSSLDRAKVLDPDGDASRVVQIMKNEALDALNRPTATTSSTLSPLAPVPSSLNIPVPSPPAPVPSSSTIPVPSPPAPFPSTSSAPPAPPLPSTTALPPNIPKKPNHSKTVRSIPKNYIQQDSKGDFDFEPLRKK